jgi:hypothetical protein
MMSTRACMSCRAMIVVVASIHRTMHYFPQDDFCPGGRGHERAKLLLVGRTLFRQSLYD